MEKTAKIVFLITAVAVSLFLAQREICKVLAVPNSKDFDCSKEKLDKDLSEKKRQEIKNNYEKALKSMQDTNVSLISLAILIIGGTIGLPLAKKLVPIGDRNFSLILLLPSWLFLIYSVEMGLLFKQRLSHELMLGVFAPLSRCLNDPFQLQVRFFKWGLVPVVIFIALYMIFIIVGGSANEKNQKSGENEKNAV